jgi:hypothetical protein
VICFFAVLSTMFIDYVDIKRRRDYRLVKVDIIPPAFLREQSHPLREEK